MKLFAFINQKGGVGKTTIAINLARALSLRGYKTLLIDADPQANAGSGLGIRVKKDESLYQALVEGNCESFIHEVCPNLFLLPSSIDLVGLELELAEEKDREFVFKNLLLSSTFQGKHLLEGFDYILFDAPPSLSLITVNILTAVEGVVIPLQCEYYALEGLSLLVRTVRGIKNSFNPELRLFGLILNMFDGRNRLSQEVAEEARKHFAWIIFKTLIPRSIRVSEAQSHGKSILDYEPNHKVSQAFLTLADEFIERAKQQEKLKGAIYV